ncbi:TIGR02281 family clan AA aspartic protease [Bradyrhizobium genosp. L]|uniref:TIGR02281 family clan AA aspartic protease n=1 Tax=Bradyrhizobium genosp. L TaxID=83637 RepID=UPI0018A2F468|nr:TIGR02281 family clan AA aspartic protease [Bradyrhizobium genosp. L]QPF84627.1 TIGR02281 family clan AA aspartic protease [Bradyrhizobium genosp. L]
MRNLIILAAILVGLGTGMSQLASKMAPAAATPVKQTAAPAITVAQASARTLTIAPDPRGHFATDGRIDGQRLDFMVDTGASLVALNEKSAARFGLRPTPGDYKLRISTANGTIKAARSRIAMIELGGLIVRDVDVMVLPDEALSENLLGLSFLSKLKRFEYTGGKLVLEQ